MTVGEGALQSQAVAPGARPVGQSVPRVDAVEKVTGRARYTGDLKIPGMLHAVLLRSPVAHARIRSIDKAAAERVPGVVAVVTASDFKGFDPVYGRIIKDRPVLAMDKVRFTGEPVAAVIATDRHAAREALMLIDVDYEELPVLDSIEAALAEGAPRLHEAAAGNICFRDEYGWGDLAEAAKESDEVFTDTFTFPKVFHYAMEPHIAIAQPEGNGVRIWASTQHAYVTRREVAKQFGLPPDAVRVEVPYVGGAFGGKSYKLEPLAVALALHVGRPVRLELSVEESFYTDRRHSAKCVLRTGVKRDGTLVFREAALLFDTGAYAEVGPRVIVLASHRVLGPYRWRAVKVESTAVYTNTTPAGSFRAIGAPQTIWACESQMDMIAERLAIDPVEFRLRNLASHGEAFRPGMLPLDSHVDQVIRAAWEPLVADGPSRSRAGVGGAAPGNTATPASRPGEDGVAPKAVPARGRGIAVGVKSGGSEPLSVAVVRLFPDGTALLLASTAEMGQGAQTALAQICADTLSLPVDKVRVSNPDTAITPYDQLTGASRSTVLVGRAVLEASLDVRQQLAAAAAAHFGVDPGEVALENGEVVTPKGRAPLADVFHSFFGFREGELVGRGYSRAARSQTPGLRDTGTFWEVAAAAAEIDLDWDTGQIRVTKYVSAADVGKAINPALCRAQDEGAAMQGLGHTLFEEMVYEGGQLLNPNLVDYRVPRFTDVPPVFQSVLVENGDGPGPFGSKGVGEAGIMCAAPAVANALARLTGIRIQELPLTPERVWRALREKQKGGARRDSRAG